MYSFLARSITPHDYIDTVNRMQTKFKQ